eukprot:m.1352113 g.1352113  ORF g.1352113 m.1352113 type:complete len:68 (+) comp24923_c0_seq52:3611-3814(+)
MTSVTSTATVPGPTVSRPPPPRPPSPGRRLPSWLLQHSCQLHGAQRTANEGAQCGDSNQLCSSMRTG